MTFRLSLALAGLALSLASCGVSSGPPPADRAPDLAFLPNRPEKGRIFTMYNHHGPSIRSGNWTSRFDLTGVSWNDTRTATAISRNHVVMAAHYIRPTTVPLIFHDRSGGRHIRTLTQVQTLTSVGDIAVGRLNEPLPAGVAHYPLASPQDAAVMRLALVTDQTMTVSLHRIGRVSAGRVMLGYDPNIPKTYNRNLVSGDSGNPAFVISGSGLRLLTTFSTGGPGTGPFYGEPAISAAVAQTMARLP
jgi:predicted small lipoprotein YifL